MTFQHFIYLQPFHLYMHFNDDDHYFFFRELHDGTLKDNGLIDESKIILIPNVETGLLVSIHTHKHKLRACT